MWILRATLFVVGVGFDDLHTAPSPIYAVILDQPVSYLHHFEEIHLLAVRRGTRIFPYEKASVGEVAATIEGALSWFSGRGLVKQLAYRFAARQNAVVSAKKIGNERAFQHSIGRIERYHGVKIIIRPGAIPRAINIFNCFGRHLGHGCEREVLAHELLLYWGLY